MHINHLLAVIATATIATKGISNRSIIIGTYSSFQGGAQIVRTDNKIKNKNLNIFELQISFVAKGRYRGFCFKI